jgi:hypothetical protein
MAEEPKKCIAMFWLARGAALAAPSGLIPAHLLFEAGKRPANLELAHAQAYRDLGLIRDIFVCTFRGAVYGAAPGSRTRIEQVDCLMAVYSYTQLEPSIFGTQR